MDLAQRLILLQQRLFEYCAPLAGPFPAYTLIFSVSDGNARAETLHVSDSSLAMAWRRGMISLKKRMELRGLQGKYLRVDWVTGAAEKQWSAFEQFLHGHKRNYCRFGVAFDHDFSVILTEQECNANAIYYGGVQIAHAVFNEKNFTVYQKKRFPRFQFKAEENSSVWAIATAGVFCDEAEQVFLIPSPGDFDEGTRAGLEAGHRVIPELTPDLADKIIAESADWLARQIQPSGKYVYGYFPCFDREINTYNSLRHASSTYSLLEAWEYTSDGKFEPLVTRALEYMTKNLVRRYEVVPDSKMAFLVDDVAGEIKLGGNGVALLALVKWTELTGSSRYLPLMELLAAGIGWMQHPETGEFVHVLHAENLALKNRYRTIYYDGEAVFGLLRFYGLTKNEHWLNMAKKSFDSFLDGRHAAVHDHWLSYSVNEITQYIPDERYFHFGINNIADYLDFIQNRETTFPTLLELCMAAQAMFGRLDKLPELRYLLDSIDMARFRQARDHRARYLLNGFFWPELAMFYKNPDRITGAFFIRHHAFRTRIDDAEHYLSGLIAYANMLKQQEKAAGDSEVFCWNAETLQSAARGVWVVPPADDWQAHGVCVYHESFKPGDILVARGQESPKGLSAYHVQSFAAKASAIISTEPEKWRHTGLPVLRINAISGSIIALARALRENFSGKVLSITGTSGKTSMVALARHLLAPFGVTGSSIASANMLYGIAWNMLAMPYDAKWWVVEQSLARMGETAQLVRPDAAIVLNVSEAHLTYWKNTFNIASQKSKIFTGMKAGSRAAVNRDMEHFGVFAMAAAENVVELITFGRHERADMRLLDVSDGTMRFACHGDEFSLPLPVTAEYMAMNYLAVLGGFLALGLPIQQFFAGFSTAKPVKGRGEVHTLRIDGKRVVLLDESYNANPSSMRAALSAFKGRGAGAASRVLVLGDMLELGENSHALHKNLIEPVLDVEPDRVLLCGTEMRQLWDALTAGCSEQPVGNPSSERSSKNPAVQLSEHSLDQVSEQHSDDPPLRLPEQPLAQAAGQYSGQRPCTFSGKWYASPEELWPELSGWLRDGDFLLIKGSNGSGLWRLVDQLQRLQQG